MRDHEVPEALESELRLPLVVLREQHEHELTSQVHQRHSSSLENGMVVQRPHAFQIVFDEITPTKLKTPEPAGLLRCYALQCSLKETPC